MSVGYVRSILVQRQNVGDQGSPQFMSHHARPQTWPNAWTRSSFLFLLSKLAFLNEHAFFFPFSPTLPSRSNDFYCITFQWITFYAYDTTVPYSSFHNPLSLHHQIPHTFSVLLEKLELSLLHSPSFWALSMSCWKFTYLIFVKQSHFIFLLYDDDETQTQRV